MASTVDGMLSRLFAVKAWTAPPAKNDSSVEFYIHTSESELIERTWDGAEFGVETLVATDYEPEAAVAYVQLGDKRVVVYVDIEGNLGQAEYDDEEEIWNPAEIFSKTEIKLDPKTNFSSVKTKSGVALVYQDQEHNLVSVLVPPENAADRPQTEVYATGAILGTPILFSLVGEQICLLYFHTDGFLHYKALEGGEDQKWDAPPIPNPSQIKGLASFSTNEGDSKPEIYYLQDDGSVSRINEKGEITEYVQNFWFTHEFSDMSLNKETWSLSAVIREIKSDQLSPERILGGHNSSTSTENDSQLASGGITDLQQKYIGWIKRLSFRQTNGKRSTGTGFYVNIPHCQYDVMFTAAHNLVDRHSNPTKLYTDLKITTSIENEDSEKADKDVGNGKEDLGKSTKDLEKGDEDLKIEQSWVRYCSNYITAKDTVEAEASDYGVILIPRANDNSGSLVGGFGFDLFLGMLDLSTMTPKSVTVNITSYPRGVTEATFCSGYLFDCTEKQLKYTSATATGSSGGPVWLGYGPFGSPVVIGIHNYGEPNRATRLNVSVLLQIFEWCEIGLYDKAIRTTGKKYYLQFNGESDEEKFPSITCNASPEQRNFSLLPASSSEIYPSEPGAKDPNAPKPKSPLYFLLCKLQDGDHYVDFDPLRDDPVLATKRYTINCQLEITYLIPKSKPRTFMTAMLSGFRIFRKIEGDQFGLKFDESEIDPSDPAQHESSKTDTPLMKYLPRDIGNNNKPYIAMDIALFIRWWNFKIDL
ncbi:hypothetical protein TWF788_007645 [Orbilia oligospora]|uniref:Serine protease n=1 Tax=Orbilia oligospora TaxID=2813651 RepID=A0A7C8PSG3_ORBOL|nr:hypothetical protein TWF788_007645 [Orbilia oligospora]